MDCVEYLTRENPKEEAKGKYLYPDSAVRANFDFHAELTVRAERKAKYGSAADRMMPVKEMEIHVLQDGWSVRQSRAIAPWYMWTCETSFSRFVLITLPTSLQQAYWMVN